MKISGFTMVRNATRLYYPVKESIESVLPICDEFIVALGKGDADDKTEQRIRSIGSDKIKIIHTEWDMNKFPGGTVYAQQTDVAKAACTGDWLFYIQSDEAVHEKYLPVIKARCEQFLNDPEVEGLLFRYKHFWGDYRHYIVSHTWYPNEIRVIRNLPDIHSWKDAQSFRRIPGFDGINYMQKRNAHKLKVVKVDAEIFHYGWVRPPRYMQQKRKTAITVYNGASSTQKVSEELEDFNYGDLSKLEIYRDPHPRVLEPWISDFNWQDQLYPVRPAEGVKHKHDRIKYRLLTFVEQNFLRGNLIGGFKNYRLLKSKSFVHKEYTMPHPVKISATVITFNEEKKIEACIQSLTEVADEIVVVDSFSTDRTREICSRYPVRFITHPFEGYIAQKNYAMQQAAYDHVLSLDADERLSDRLKESILEVKKNWGTLDGYAMNRLNNYCGQWIRHSGWYPDRKIRLWDRRKATWEGEDPHDFLRIPGERYEKLKGDILHYTFLTVDEHIRQVNKFAEVAARAKYKKGGRASLLIHVVLNPWFRFVRTYFFQLGFLDGYYGFVICVSSAFTNFLKYLRLYEYQKKGLPE